LETKGLLKRHGLPQRHVQPADTQVIV